MSTWITIDKSDNIDWGIDEDSCLYYFTEDFDVIIIKISNSFHRLEEEINHHLHKSIF